MNLKLLKSRWHIYFGSFIIALFVFFIIYNYFNLNASPKSLPPDIDFGHYHGIEGYGDNYYVLREFNIDSYKEYYNEFWRYNKNTLEGEKIFGDARDFRVDPQEKYVALNTKVNNLKILDLKTKEIIFEQIEKIEKDEYLMIKIEEWSDNGQYFWFTKNLYGPGSGFDSLHKLNINNFQIENYDLRVLDEYDLNPDSKMLVYSDYPASYDIFGFFKVANEKEQTTLFVYDLKTKNSKLLLSQKVGKFLPKWIDNNTIEYTHYPPLNQEMINFLEELEIKIISSEDYEIDEIRMYEIYNNWEKDKTRKRIDIE